MNKYWLSAVEQYAAAMADFLARARNEGARCMAFGDLYLQDVRRYREERMRGTGIEAVFPLWEKPTRVLPAEFAGRELTSALLASMPPNIDPCGENGEFTPLPTPARCSPSLSIS